MENFENGLNIVDLIVKDGSYVTEFLLDNPIIVGQYRVPSDHVIIYVDQSDLPQVINRFGINRIGIFPTLFGLLDRASLEASGIIQMHNQPYLSLTGSGVLLGFVDTGIDYTLNAFRYEDGTSKICGIWDQTIEGTAPERFHFGSEYSNQQLNEALSSDNPLDIVPHTDDVGHGTFLASVAGSREPGEYIGAAPDSQILMVKLRKARQFYIDRFLVPASQENIYEATDIILGIEFLLETAGRLNRPIAICIAVGTNAGGHDGSNPIEEYLSSISNRTGVAISVAAGNESQAHHHTNGTIEETGASQEIAVRVPDDAENFIISFWNGAADRMSLSLRSPTGEVVGRVVPKPGAVYESTLLFEKSRVTIQYYFPVGATGAQLTYCQVINPIPGIWTFILYGDLILDGTYHSWLPITGSVSPGIEFLAPTPNYTVVIPGTTIGVITCGAYDTSRKSLYVDSSWGPTRLPVLTPDFVAPGVNVAGIYPTGYGIMSGTSVSSAITTGACALMLQWGVVNGNELSLNTYRIRAFLIAGCIHEPNIEYPSFQWGYGELNLYNTFNVLRNL